MVCTGVQSCKYIISKRSKKDLTVPGVLWKASLKQSDAVGVQGKFIAGTLDVNTLSCFPLHPLIQPLPPF